VNIGSCWFKEHGDERIGCKNSRRQNRKSENIQKVGGRQKKR
jgi:hypothetical protein